MRIEESVPSDDDFDKTVRYTITDDCLIEEISGEVKRSVTRDYFRSAQADTCRRTFAVQTIKDPLNLVVSRLSMSGTRCWNGSSTYFSGPRSAHAEAPLWWNNVIQNARFTSNGDTYGSTATMTATARFNSKWVKCGISQGRNYSMINRLTATRTGGYSAGFSHDLPCGQFIRVENSHYQR